MKKQNDNLLYLGMALISLGIVFNLVNSTLTLTIISIGGILIITGLSKYRKKEKSIR